MRQRDASDDQPDEPARQHLSPPTAEHWGQSSAGERIRAEEERPRALEGTVAYVGYRGERTFDPEAGPGDVLDELVQASDASRSTGRGRTRIV